MPLVETYDDLVYDFGLSPLVHNDGSVYNRSGSGGAFLANDASELLLEQWLRRPQNQPEFVPTADPFQGISQEDMAYRMAPLKPRTDFERKVQAEEVLGLGVPPWQGRRDPEEEEGEKEEGESKGAYTRQGIEEIAALRDMGASRIEAARIVTKYEANRTRKLDPPQVMAEYEPIMCYEKEGRFIPVETDYGHKRQQVRELAKEAATRMGNLEKSSAEIAKLQQQVDVEHEKCVRELKKRCGELHAAVEQRQTELEARLEKMRTVKADSLDADAEECKQLMGGIENLVESIEAIVTAEADPDVFMNKVQAPEAALQAQLERDDRWVADVTVSYGAHLEFLPALRSIQNINFKDGEPPPAPARMRGVYSTSSPGMQALQAHVGATQSAAEFVADLENRETRIVETKTELEGKQKEMIEAVAAEAFHKASSLKEETVKLESRLRWLQVLPKSPSQSP